MGFLWFLFMGLLSDCCSGKRLFLPLLFMEASSILLVFSGSMMQPQNTQVCSFPESLDWIGLSLRHLGFGHLM